MHFGENESVCVCVCVCRNKLKTGPERTQMSLKLYCIVIITKFHMFKKLKKRPNMLGKDKEDIKRSKLNFQR